MSDESDTTGTTIGERMHIHVSLNLKRLTAGQLRCLVAALEVLFSGSYLCWYSVNNRRQINQDGAGTT